jgi:hypothetical protein
MCMLALDRLDKLLRPLRSAFHNASCATYPFEEAKKDQIISEILDWANDSRHVHDSTPVFLLHGDSRSAATTIAHGVMNEAQKNDKLLASYFVSWNGESKHRDSTDLIPTIMYQFARFDRSFLQLLADAVEVDRDIRHRDSSTQIMMLFDLPFSGIVMPSGPSPLIIIDALDACGVVGDTGIASGISSFIAKLTEKLSLRIKLFITCRSAQVMQQILEIPSSQPMFRSLVLNDCRPQGETSFVSSKDRGMYGELISASRTNLSIACK